MPGRIFSQLRIPTPQLDKAFTIKNPSTVSITEVDSMDSIKRSGISNLTKRHGSSDRNKDKENKDRSSSKDGNKSKAKGAAPPAPVSLSMIMESPPNLLIGSPNQSTGLIISGRVQITPIKHETILEDLNMYLECTTISKRPVQDKCRECSTKVVDLYEWQFLSKPKLVSTIDGVQELPFSYLVPGHLATTTHATLGSIDYSLHIRARSSDNQTIEFRRELPLQRALVPGPEKHSVRIFPPTTLTMHAKLPNVVHPIGEFPVACRMTGINTRNGDTVTRWRLRKLTWRVEEHEVAVFPACGKHVAQLGGEGKAIQHESKRELSTEELKEGWKTNFDADNGDGVVEGEFHVSIDPASNPQTGIDSACAGINGQPSVGYLKVSHHLVLELVIAEEVAPAKRPQQVTPTGAARVLRTQFHLNLTQRAGMGLAWDDETPPVYEDVTASPPHYLGAPSTRVEELDGAETERRFSLDN